MSRSMPPEVRSIVNGGLRYEQAWSKPGTLFVCDEKSGNKIWELELYRCPLVPGLEADVQAVYFRTMQLSEDRKTLIIENEKNETFVVNLGRRQLID